MGAPGGAQRSGAGGEKKKHARLGEVEERERVLPREAVESEGNPTNGETWRGGGEAAAAAAALCREAGPEWAACVCARAHTSRRAVARGGGRRTAVSQGMCMSISVCMCVTVCVREREKNGRAAAAAARAQAAAAAAGTRPRGSERRGGRSDGGGAAK